MHAALLLVDLQQDYLATTGIQPSAETLIRQALALLDGCRKLRIPIVHIWTTIHRDNDRRLAHWRASDRWDCVWGTAGHQPPARLEPMNGEEIVHKTGFNAFADARLDAVLRNRNCDTVLLAGLHLHACIRTAAVECLERGYRVVIAEDAVASNDAIHASSTRRWLAERCVEFVSTPALLAALKSAAPPALVHRSPRVTSQVLFEVPIAGAGEIASATSTARSSWNEWRRTPMPFRLEMLESVAKRLEAAARDLARQMAIEIGKPAAHGLEEACRAAQSVRDVAARASRFEPISRESRGRIRYEPLGVVAVISPWNNPVAIPAGKIAPALAYGNTVVWKPAPAATRIAQTVLGLMHEAGVPDGAVQLVTGDHTTALRLATEENVGAVTLTGSSMAGYAIQEICARRVMPFQAELSGNNAAIVWHDADLKLAAEQVAWGAFGFAGQRCTANRRVIVPAVRFDDFLAAAKVATERLVWGDPLEEATEIGPVIDTGKRDETAALVAAVAAQGALHHVELLHKTRAGEPWVNAGAYAQPVIVGCDRPDHPLVQEETMSPLLVVQRAENFEHALTLCNGVRYGLAASLFSHTRELQQRFLEKAQAGILKLNASTAGVDVSLPFGGWKASGLGPPEHGEGDRLFYTRMQAVYGCEEE